MQRHILYLFTNDINSNFAVLCGKIDSRLKAAAICSGIQQDRKQKIIIQILFGKDKTDGAITIKNF